MTDVADKVGLLVKRQRLPSEAVGLLATRRTQPWRAGLVLTDDYSPYDLLIGTLTKEDPALD
jgi:hypothetical protein